MISDLVLSVDGASHLASGTGFEPPWLRILGALAVCSLVAYALARLRRSVKLPALGRPSLRGGRQVRILEARRLSANAEICRLAWIRREYLVVVTHGGALLLAEVASEEGEAAGNP